MQFGVNPNKTWIDFMIMISVILWFMLLITAVLTVILFHQSIIPFSRDQDFKGIFLINSFFAHFHGMVYR